MLRLFDLARRAEKMLASFLAAFAVALAAFLSTTPVAAEGRPRVEVVLAGPAEDAAQLEAVLRELIGHLPVTPAYERAPGVDPHEVITPRPDAQPALARVWLELGKRERATLYIVDGPWERVLVRHIPLKSGVDEVAREQIGLIVSAGLDALLSGARIGLTREEAERKLFGAKRSPSAVSAVDRNGPAGGSDAGAAGRKQTGRASGTRDGATAQKPESRAASTGVPDDYSQRDLYDWRGPRVPAAPIDLGLYYEAQAWSSDRLLVHGPAAWLHVAFRRARAAPGLWVSAQYRFPVTVDDPPIGVRLLSGGARALGTYDYQLARRTAVRLAGGLGLDLVNIEPRQLTEEGGVALASERSTLVPFARILGALQHRFIEDTTFSVAFVTDLELADASYVVESSSGNQVVFDPWTIRPGLVIGVATYLVAPP